MKAYLILLTFPVVIAFYPSIQGMQSLQSKITLNKLASFLAGIPVLFAPIAANAGMLIFPLPSPLKNNYVFVRSAESYSDARHEIQTNPVKKLRQDNALTVKGREEAKEAVKRMNELGFSPSYIWTSNTERAYETAVVIARELQLGQNRIVPEYSFLDARAAGAFEGKDRYFTHRNPYLHPILC